MTRLLAMALACALAAAPALAAETAPAAKAPAKPDKAAPSETAAAQPGCPMLKGAKAGAPGAMMHGKDHMMGKQAAGAAHCPRMQGKAETPKKDG